MEEVPAPVRKQLAETAACILSTNHHLKTVDFYAFSWKSDSGEGAVVLSALARSPSLASITHFKVCDNYSWFRGEDSESNMEHLCAAITKMTSLNYLNLCFSYFNTEQCEQMINCIVANHQANPSLKDINLCYAGGDDNENFS